MTIYCSKCGKQHPDDANFCMGCGQPLKAEKQPSQSTSRSWEYKDILVQFPKDGLSNINVDNRKQYQAAAQLADSIILTHLQQEGSHGWQADGPTDFRTLDQLHLMQTRKKVILTLTPNAERVTYEEVTLRLKRLIP